MPNVPVKLPDMGIVKETMLVKTAKLADQKDEIRLSKKIRIIIFGVIAAALIGVGLLLYFQIKKPSVKAVAKKAAALTLAADLENLDDMMIYPYRQRFKDGLYDQYAVDPHSQMAGIDLTDHSDFTYQSLNKEIYYLAYQKYLLDWASPVRTDVINLKRIDPHDALYSVDEKYRGGIQYDDVKDAYRIQMKVTVPQEAGSGYEYDVAMLLGKIGGKWKVFSVSGLPYDDLVDYYYEGQNKQ